jgi:SAM-dependent methyltransferase
VLDLGSGAGIDLLLAAKLAGPEGKAIGVDMTKVMIERARLNALVAGLTNVEVREGIIESLPVDSKSVDLVISNCVINLSPEKQRVFSEIHRVLKAGGRFSISDIVAEPMPEWITKLEPLRSACITGAITESAYLEGLRAAGLVDVKVVDRLVYDASQLAGLLGSETGGGCCCGESEALPKELLGRVTEALAGKVASVRFVGRKVEESAP